MFEINNNLKLSKSEAVLMIGITVTLFLMIWVIGWMMLSVMKYI